MPRRPQLPAVLAGRHFPGRLAIERGLLTTGQLRSHAWRQLFRGVYVDATRPDTHRLRCAAALRWLLPKGTAVAGRSAAALYGIGVGEAADPVEVLVPPPNRVGVIRGLRVHHAPVDADDLRHHRGLLMTSPVRTCWDLAAWLDPVEAVVIVDRLLSARVVSPEVLRDYASTRGRRRGWRRFSRLLLIADGRAESPQESRLRVRLWLAGLPPPRVQYEVHGSNGFIARVDLAWPEWKIAIEYDGLHHVGSAWQMNADRRRLNRLLAEGWIVLHVTATRLRDDFPALVAEINAAIRSRRRRHPAAQSTPA